MLLSILTLLAIAVVGFIGGVQRLYRTALMLAALVVAGAVACLLVGPLTRAMAGTPGDTQSTWYYAGDAICLWAVLCVAFLGLRLLTYRLLWQEPVVPATLDIAGGAVVGVAAGYLVVGLCLVICQMLPVAPSFLGYEPFRYVEGTSMKNPEHIERGNTVWLAPDRAAIWLFDHLAGGGAEGGALLGRYGDAYPPASLRLEPYTPAVNADDFLYYHWYRRWQAVRWRTNRVAGPVEEIPKRAIKDLALKLERRAQGKVYGMKLQINSVVRSDGLAGFPEVEPPPGEEFVEVRLRFDPDRRLPRVIDSDQFYLMDPSGKRVAGPPLVLGDAEVGPDGAPRPSKRSSTPDNEPRNLRFVPPRPGQAGTYLCDGIRYFFTEHRHYEERILIFRVPKALHSMDVRLFMDPQPSDAAEAPRTPAETAGGA
ncbi:MAG: CvpA family protein [Planctomycetes bacterium]|nr:CvpA family protein [Planctomycetota bacterium]